MDKEIKRTKIVVDNVGRKPFPVIAREYVEKNYIHKDKIKERINYLNSLYSDSDDYQRQFIIDIVSFLEELLKE